MFQKVFEYAGPHKKGLYAATAVVLVSVLMGDDPAKEQPRQSRLAPYVMFIRNRFRKLFHLK